MTLGDILPKPARLLLKLQNGALTFFLFTKIRCDSKTWYPTHVDNFAKY